MTACITVRKCLIQPNFVDMFANAIFRNDMQSWGAEIMCRNIIKIISDPHWIFKHFIRRKGLQHVFRCSIQQEKERHKGEKCNPCSQAQFIQELTRKRKHPNVLHASCARNATFVQLTTSKLFFCEFFSSRVLTQLCPRWGPKCMANRKWKKM